LRRFVKTNLVRTAKSPIIGVQNLDEEVTRRARNNSTEENLGFEASRRRRL
jgi:hypothetical protein